MSKVKAKAKAKAKQYARSDKPFGIFDPPRSKLEKQITNEIESVVYFCLQLLLVVAAVVVGLTILGLILVVL